MTEGIWLGNLGLVFTDLSDYRRAIAYFDSASTIANKIDDQSRKPFWLLGLGRAYDALSNYPLAITYYDSALAIARQIGNRMLEGTCLGALGMENDILGNVPKAISYYESALLIAREVGDRRGENSWLGMLGNVHDILGNSFQSIAYYDSALIIAREIGLQLNEGAWLGGLGQVHFRLGNYSQAIAYYDSSLMLARRIGDHIHEGVWLSNLSEACERQGNYTKAIAYADSARIVAQELDNVETVWRQYWTFARVHAKASTANTDQIIDYYDRALAELAKITNEISTDAHKQSYVEGKQGLYEDYINYLMAQSEFQYHTKALEISEASRTRALRDLLQEQRVQSSHAGMKRIAAAKRTEELFREYTGVQIAQADFPPALRAGIDDSLESWAMQIPIPPDTLGSSESAPAIGTHDIQAEAKSNTLLEYHVLDDGIATWVVNQNGEVFSHKQPIPKADLHALIDSVRHIIGAANSASDNARSATSGATAQASASRSVLHALDSLLIQPVARYLPKDSSQEIIILPHDDLFLLPFACLIDNRGKYLAERYTFSTAPSVGMLKFTRERSRAQQSQENSKLLLMGNPTMPETARWPSLPGTEMEVRRIAQYVNRQPGADTRIQEASPLQALPLTGHDATEAELRQIASAQDYVHLATHGYVVSDALRCGLVLAKTGNTMATDGILTTAEIFGLPLHAELVVLSACQTGLGQISSDGVAGLSRAFLYAGTSSLIVSLWKVSDAATPYLMLKFYEELARDGNKARALRAAQLHAMKTFRHPRDWAAFVLVGQPK